MRKASQRLSGKKWLSDRGQDGVGVCCKNQLVAFGEYDVRNQPIHTFKQRTISRVGDV